MTVGAALTLLLLLLAGLALLVVAMSYRLVCLCNFNNVKTCPDF